MKNDQHHSGSDTTSLKLGNIHQILTEKQWEYMKPRESLSSQLLHCEITTMELKWHISQLKTEITLQPLIPLDSETLSTTAD